MQFCFTITRSSLLASDEWSRSAAKLSVPAGVLAALFISVLSAHSQSSKLLTTTVSPREDVQFGDLVNAPNGHLSYQTNSGGFKIWVAGRLTQHTNLEGGFLLTVPDWSSNRLALATASATNWFGTTNRGVGNAFDRDYAALNAVVPGTPEGTLLGFYDAEFHPLSTPAKKVGQPLLSSLGLAISTDGGITWVGQGQVIQGLDWAMLGKDAVVSNQVYLATNVPPNIMDDGANSPSVVLRTDRGTNYIYLYYSDRTNFGSNAPPYSIYLARSLLASNGLAGSWQKWTGAGWGVPGAQFPAAAVVTPPPNRLEAEHPSVSYNTVLNCWVMFFKTHTDFQLASSDDGVQWNLPKSLFQFDTHDLETGFPTYVTPDPPGVLAINYPTQQTTGGQGWMYYSSHPPNSNYIGHRVRVTLQSLVPTLNIQRAGHGITISWAPVTPGFVLETTTNLTLTDWSAIAGTNGISMLLDSTSRFYRLRLP